MLRYALWIDEAKVVTVRKFSNGVMLCAVEQNENNAPSVQIYRRERNQKKQMALHFQHGNDSYFPKVDGETLTLEKAAGSINQSHMSDSHWFEKENQGAGDHYCLRSVVDPTQYLSTTGVTRRQCILSLSKTPQESVLVTEKKIE